MSFSINDCEQSLTQRLDSQVQNNPHNIAVQTDHCSLSYQTLRQKACRLAAALLSHTNQPDCLVALLLPQGSAFITAVFGTLYARAAFVPLDPSNPTDRNRHILKDCQARWLLTDCEHHAIARDLIKTLPEQDCSIIRIDQLPDQAGEPLLPTATADDLAYVLYTSGSTGTPKGVMQNHRNVLHNVMRHSNAFHITSTDRQSLLYPCSVYGGIRDIFNAILNGASLWPFPVKEHSLKALSLWLEENQITLYCSVATVFRHWAASLDEGRHFPHLRIIKLGGEAVLKKDIQLFQQHFMPTCKLSLGLAATEMGGVTQQFFTTTTPIPTTALSLGEPTAGIKIDLLDANQHPVSPGEIGEIAVTGRHLFLGYWQQAALTKQRLLSNKNNPAIKTYLTGDRGQRLADGRLLHKGRTDLQVKIRGNRIDLTEIEASLQTIENIKDAAVIVTEDNRGEPSLVALLTFNTPPENETAHTNALRNALKQQLPDVMIPACFIQLASMPLTPNGKIDRQALPRLVKQGSAIPRPVHLPTNPIEIKLSQLLTATLKIPPPDINHSLTTLGMTSLLMAGLLDELSEHFSIQLVISDLIDNSSIASLSKRIDYLITQQEEHPASNQEKIPDNLVPIRTKGTNPPVFAMAAAFGTVHHYYALAMNLTDDQPFYGLQDPDTYQSKKRFKSIATLASINIKTIKTIQRDGPYYLCGWSVGGLVAFEMAQQLSRQGEQVAFLGIIDTRPELFGQGLWPIRKLRSLLWLCQGAYYTAPYLKEMVHFSIVQKLRSSGTGKQTDHNELKKLPWKAQYKQTEITNVTRKHSELFTQSPPPLHRILLNIHYNIKALLQYKADHYDGDISLFLAGSKSEQQKNKYTWDNWTSGEIKTAEIKGNHFTLFRPDKISTIIEVFQHHLHQAQIKYF